MKLLVCYECHDMVRIYPEWRWCKCGKSAGRSLKDEVSVQIFGSSKIAEINTVNLIAMLNNKKYSTTIQYVSEDGNKIQRTKKSP
jgi:hypothetical protein